MLEATSHPRAASNEPTPIRTPHTANNSGFDIIQPKNAIPKAVELIIVRIFLIFYSSFLRQTQPI